MAPPRQYTVEDLKRVMRWGHTNVAAAARALGCRRHTVRRLAKEGGITFEVSRHREHAKRGRVTEAVRLFLLEKKPIEEVAAAMRLSPKTVTAYLVQTGLIETREQRRDRRRSQAFVLIEQTDLGKGEIAQALGLHPSQLSRMLQKEAKE